MAVVDLHTRESGTGAALVLLHAFPLSSAMWLTQREALGDVCRVVTPDQRGFGGSQLGTDEPALDAAADDVAALLDSRGLDRVVLGGLSMGGYVAMAFLRRHPQRVAALVLSDTKAAADPPAGRDRREALARAMESDPDPAALVEQLLPTLLGRTSLEQRPLVVGRVRGLIQAAPPAAVAWASRAMAARPDSFDTLRSAEVPALVVVGEEDQLSPVADAEATAAALPQARLAVIPQAGHLPPLEAPEEFNRALRTFLAELS